MRSFYPQNKIKLSKLLLDGYEGELSYAAFCRILRKKDVKVDGKRVNHDVTLFGGEQVDVYFDGDKNIEFYSEIFRDDNIIIIDKAKGITSEALYEKLKFSYGEVYFCHRLDRNTDGLIVFATNPEAYAEITEGFKIRSFDKIYLAVVYGLFDKKHDVLTAYMTKDEEISLVKMHREKVVGSKEVKTEYVVISQTDNTSVLLVRLLTGRTHQIRAHLAFCGHFVLGDGKYGSEKINRQLKIKDMKLSSVTITFKFDENSRLRYLDGRTFSKKTGVDAIDFQEQKNFFEIFKKS